MPRVSVEYSQVSKSTYKLFCEEHPDLKLTFTQFLKIVYGFNYAFRDYLLETGNKGKLPGGIGDFGILKKKNDITALVDETSRRRAEFGINWVETKRLGHYVYHLNTHTDGFKFKFKWFSLSARYKCSKIWYFRPSRISSRTLKHYILQKEYVSKYIDWTKN